MAAKGYRQLTEKIIGAIVAPERNARDYPDRKIAGLYLRVQPSGVRTWRLQYTFGGKRRWHVLGTYPELGVADARAMAEETRTRIAKGIDPAQARKEERAAEDVLTFGKLWREYYELEGSKLTTARDKELIVEKHFMRALRDRPAQEITKREVLALLKPVLARGPMAANKAADTIARVFSWAESMGKIESSPLRRIPKLGGADRIRDRVLNADEIRAVWEALEDYPGRYGANRALQLVLLLGVRPGEARHFSTAHVTYHSDEAKGDRELWQSKLRLKTYREGHPQARPDVPAYYVEWMGRHDPLWWTIPGELTKTGEPHQVPITGLCAHVIAPRLGVVDSAWLFSHRGRPFTSYAPIAEWVKAQTGIADFMPYVLRHTVADHLAQMGVDLELVKLILGHGVRGAIRNYVQHRYQEPRLRAIRAWHDRLRAILGLEDRRGEVVAFPARAQ